MNTTTKDQVEANNERRKKNAKWWMFGGTFLVLVAPFLISRDIGLPPFTESTASVGDTIGGITAPIVGIMGAVLVYYALLAQIEANKQINDQFQEQKKITYRQNFEQVFFNMLNLHRDNVNNFSLVPSDILWELNFDDKALKKISLHDDDGMRVAIYNIENKLDPNEAEKPFEHRAFFKYSITRLIELIYLTDKYGGLDKKVKKTKFEATENRKAFYSFFHHIYETLFHRLDTYLGHYYRNLYRMVKYIDEQTFSEDKEEDYRSKYFYISIVRSQLSDHEIQWLFFNGLFDYGELFKPLIEKYSMLKNLRYHKNETIKKFKSQYENIAFEELVWIKTTDSKTGKETYSIKPEHEKYLALIKE